MHQHPRLAAAGARNDQQIPNGCRNSLALTIIQTIENMSDVHTYYGSTEEALYTPCGKAIRPSPTLRDCVVDRRPYLSIPRHGTQGVAAARYRRSAPAFHAPMEPRSP